jgi:subtilisin family serine protease
MAVTLQGMSITQGSSYGPRLSVMAPSVDIASAMPHEAGFYAVSDSPTGATQSKFEGSLQVQAVGATSMATPVVTSLVALVRSVRPDLRARQVIQIIQRSAVDLGERGVDQKTGHGRIDFRAAIAMARDWPRSGQ